MKHKIFLKNNIIYKELKDLLRSLNSVEIVYDEIDADHIIDFNNEETKLIFSLLKKELIELIKQRDSHEELKAILQSSTEGIEAVDMHGNVKYVNPAFLKITNIKKTDRVNQNIFEKNPNGLLAKVLKHGQPLHNVTTHAPGSGVEAIASATPVYFKEKMIGAVIVVSDISNTIRIAKELDKSQSKLDTLYEKMSNPGYSFDKIIGDSILIKQTIENAKQYANSSSTILITGESGTGKELFAQSIYNYSNQRGPFIAVNCAAIPSELLESELFGHEKGTFTGAHKQRIGMFELAQNGTIFLDEIAELKLPFTSKAVKSFTRK